MATPHRQTPRRRGQNLPLLATTRGHLLVHLCRGRRTVDELAERLSVTRNAVRSHLARLERDGLVRRAGSRRGVRRPHADYELTPKGRSAFPRGYEVALKALVDVLPDHLPASTRQTVLNHAGERLIRERLGEIEGRTPRQRLVHVLSALGPFAASVEVQQRAGATVVHACSCPLASVTKDYPELCRIVAGLLGEAVAGDVREACIRDGWPQCRFELIE
jgi:DeoR family transcriptional regulator, suf operon transcriptional repressor